MGGFMGIGGSGASTDRKVQSDAQGGLLNIYNKGLGMAAPLSASGTSETAQADKALAGPQQYWTNLLKAGRTETTQNSAPQIDAVLAHSDAARRQEATHGTDRVGGTAAANREAGAGTSASIDQIINQNLVGGRQAGAQGLTQVAQLKASMGEAQMKEALSAMGLSESAVNSVMNNAGNNYQFDTEQQNKLGDAIGSALAMAFLG